MASSDNSEDPTAAVARHSAGPSADKLQPSSAVQHGTGAYTPFQPHQAASSGGDSVQEGEEQNYHHVWRLPGSSYYRGWHEPGLTHSRNKEAAPREENTATPRFMGPDVGQSAYSPSTSGHPLYYYSQGWPFYYAGANPYFPMMPEPWVAGVTGYPLRHGSGDANNSEAADLAQFLASRASLVAESCSGSYMAPMPSNSDTRGVTHRPMFQGVPAVHHGSDALHPAGSSVPWRTGSMPPGLPAPFHQERPVYEFPPDLCPEGYLQHASAAAYSNWLVAAKATVRAMHHGNHRHVVGMSSSSVLQREPCSSSSRPGASPPGSSGSGPAWTHNRDRPKSRQRPAHPRRHRCRSTASPSSS